jgi:hypothetical protein
MLELEIERDRVKNKENKNKAQEGEERSRHQHLHLSAWPFPSSELLWSQVHSAGWDSFQREMGQGKLEIFIENTSGLGLPEVPAVLRRIWGGIGACGQRSPAALGESRSGLEPQSCFSAVSTCILLSLPSWWLTSGLVLDSLSLS